MLLKLSCIVDDTYHVTCSMTWSNKDVYSIEKIFTTLGWVINRENIYNSRIRNHLWENIFINTHRVHEGNLGNLTWNPVHLAHPEQQSVNTLRRLAKLFFRTSSIIVHAIETIRRINTVSGKPAPELDLLIWITLNAPTNYKQLSYRGQCKV